jgi:hypothetical protein
VGSTSVVLDVRVRSVLQTSRFIFDSLCLDFVDVANVISKYAAAQIPPETLWIEIGKLVFFHLLHTCDLMGAVDYLDRRRTVDPNHSPLPRMR